MYLVYYIAMVTVGSAATDWANDGLFGDGWHLFGIGTSEYTEVADNYTAASEAISAYYELDTEADDFDPDAALADMKAVQPDSDIRHHRSGGRRDPGHERHDRLL